MSPAGQFATFLTLFAVAFGAGAVVLPWLSTGGAQFAFRAEPCQGDACIAEWRRSGHALSRSGDGSTGIPDYRRAALAGDAAAMFNLGALYDAAFREGIRRRSRSDATIAEQAIYGARALPSATGFEALLRAHDGLQDNIPSHEMHQRSLAWLWYRRAADAGFAPAFVNLGVMWETGAIGRTDLAAATQHYDRAARLGNPVAKVILSKLRDGNGAPVTCGARLQDRATPMPDDVAEPTFTRTGIGTGIGLVTDELHRLARITAGDADSRTAPAAARPAISPRESPASFTTLAAATGCDADAARSIITVGRPRG